MFNRPFDRSMGLLIINEFLNIPLFAFKLALLTLFLSSKVKRIFLARMRLAGLKQTKEYLKMSPIFAQGL